MLDHDEASNEDAILMRWRSNSIMKLWSSLPGRRRRDSEIASSLCQRLFSYSACCHHRKEKKENLGLGGEWSLFKPWMKKIVRFLNLGKKCDKFFNK